MCPCYLIHQLYRSHRRLQSNATSHQSLTATSRPHVRNHPRPELIRSSPNDGKKLRTPCPRLCGCPSRHTTSTTTIDEHQVDSAPQFTRTVIRPFTSDNDAIMRILSSAILHFPQLTLIAVNPSNADLASQHDENVAHLSHFNPLQFSKNTSLHNACGVKQKRGRAPENWIADCTKLEHCGSPQANPPKGFTCVTPMDVRSIRVVHSVERR